MIIIAVILTVGTYARRLRTAGGIGMCVRARLRSF